MHPPLTLLHCARQLHCRAADPCHQHRLQHAGNPQQREAYGKDRRGGGCGRNGKGNRRAGLSDHSPPVEIPSARQWNRTASCTCTSQ